MKAVEPGRLFSVAGKVDWVGREDVGLVDPGAGFLSNPNTTFH